MIVSKRSVSTLVEVERVGPTATFPHQSYVFFNLGVGRKDDHERHWGRGRNRYINTNDMRGPTE